MFRTDTITRTAYPMPACIDRPSRFHAQARPARSAFRLDSRDSAMPARFHIA